MRKILLAFSVGVLLLAVSGSVSASRVAFDATGSCDIEGTIISASFHEAFEDPCVKDNNCPVGAFVPERGARYVLSVYIESLSCVPSEGPADGPNSYKNQFQLNENNEIVLDQLLAKQGDIFEQGDRISGTVQLIQYNNTFVAYNLEESISGIDNRGTSDSKMENSENNTTYNDDDDDAALKLPLLPFVLGGLLIIATVLLLFFLKK